VIQGATISVSEFARGFRIILNAHLGSITEMFIDLLGVKYTKI
jgi:hypothetical protein